MTHRPLEGLKPGRKEYRTGIDGLGDDVAQAGNLGVQSRDRRVHEVLQDAVIKPLLLSAQPAVARNGALDIEAEGYLASRTGTKPRSRTSKGCSTRKRRRSVMKA